MKVYKCVSGDRRLFFRVEICLTKWQIADRIANDTTEDGLHIVYRDLVHTIDKNGAHNDLKITTKPWTKSAIMGEIKDTARAYGSCSGGIDHNEKQQKAAEKIVEKFFPDFKEV